MNAKAVIYRASLMIATTKLPGTKRCRAQIVDQIIGDTSGVGRTVTTRELAFFCSDGTWVEDPSALVCGCSEPECVIHLVLANGDAADLHMVAKRSLAEPRDTRSLYRRGVAKGWFKAGGGGYA